MKRWVSILGFVVGVAGVAAIAGGCGDEECGGQGENCSQAYKDENGIDYDCCDGLTCSSGATSGVLICQ